MKSIGFELKKVNFEMESCLEQSKFFGSPVFPHGFIGIHNLNNDLFICQLNLKDLSKYDTELPKEGNLYFFLRTWKSPYKAKVFYSKKETIDLYRNINEEFPEFGDGKAMLIEPSVEEKDNMIIEEICSSDSEEYDLDGYIALLRLDATCLPEGFPNLGSFDGNYYFLIKEKDLLKADFSKVLFMATES